MHLVFIFTVTIVTHTFILIVKATVSVPCPSEPNYKTTDKQLITCNLTMDICASRHNFELSYFPPNLDNHEDHLLKCNWDQQIKQLRCSKHVVVSDTMTLNLGADDKTYQGGKFKCYIHVSSDTIQTLPCDLQGKTEPGSSASATSSRPSEQTSSSKQGGLNEDAERGNLESTSQEILVVMGITIALMTIAIVSMAVILIVRALSQRKWKNVNSSGKSLDSAEVNSLKEHKHVGSFTLYGNNRNSSEHVWNCCNIYKFTFFRMHQVDNDTTSA